jgi:hypothetical protein
LRPATARIAPNMPPRPATKATDFHMVFSF